MTKKHAKKSMPKHRVLPGPPNRPGRPTAYTPDVINAVCSFYATGVSLVDAARSAGISPATARAWAKESSENPKGPKGEFWPMLRKALAQSITAAAADKKRSDPGWFLARMRPKRFGDPTKKIELGGKLDLSNEYRYGKFEASILKILSLPDKEPT